MKTPEEMAMDYIKDVETARNPSIATTAFPQLQRCFLAGYQAAVKKYDIALIEEKIKRESKEVLMSLLQQRAKEIAED